MTNPNYLKFFLLLIIVLLVIYCSTGDNKSKSKDYNVVFITLDTTRSDFIDTGKGAKAFTPEIKKFAKKSIIFEHAYSTIPQTLPAHLSIFTSYYPHECGVLSNQYVYKNRYKMIQEILKKKGYQTAGVISLGTLSSQTGFSKGFDEYREQLNNNKVFYTPAKRITQEALELLEKLENRKFFLFLHYSDPHSPYAPPKLDATFSISVNGKENIHFNAHQGAILRQHIQLNSGINQIVFKVNKLQEDFYGFVIRKLEFSNNCMTTFQNIEFSVNHYDGAHVLKGCEGNLKISCNGAGFLKLFQVIPLLTKKAGINYYRQEVEYMDRHVGKFLRSLENKQLLKNTIVVIVGDHGEGLGERERYFGHVRYLNRQFIEVPLIIYLPEVHPKRLTTPVSQINIVPTILSYLGSNKDGGGMEKKDLIPLITEKRTHGRQPIYSFVYKPTTNEDRLSVILWPYQCIFNLNELKEIWQEYYNFSISQSFCKWDEYSPEVFARDSLKAFKLFKKLFAQMSQVFRNRHISKISKDKREIENLKTLGYVQ